MISVNCKTHSNTLNRIKDLYTHEESKIKTENQNEIRSDMLVINLFKKNYKYDESFFLLK